MVHNWYRTTGHALKKCCYGTLLDVQNPDGSPCSDWRMEKCSEKPAVRTASTT